MKEKENETLFFIKVVFEEYSNGVRSRHTFNERFMCDVSECYTDREKFEKAQDRATRHYMKAIDFYSVEVVRIGTEEEKQNYLAYIEKIVKALGRSDLWQPV